VEEDLTVEAEAALEVIDTLFLILQQEVNQSQQRRILLQ
tara:strand:- start:225 stop:341 length:117 start_codon:yes stop_codon:yes gene_type:complete